LTEIFSYV
jgi:hypothetical protein